MPKRGKARKTAPNTPEKRIDPLARLKSTRGICAIFIVWGDDGENGFLDGGWQARPEAGKAMDWFRIGWMGKRRGGAGGETSGFIIWHNIHVFKGMCLLSRQILSLRTRVRVP